MFAQAMALDVLETVHAARYTPEVLTTRSLDDLADGIVTIIDKRPLSTAVNQILDRADRPIAIVMADLVLVPPVALREFLLTPGDVVIAPGRGGGTNALLVRDDEFTVDYHGTSYLDHHERAETVGADITTVDSWRLAVDIDEPEDLVEVLIHGDGHARDWLVKRGFTITKTDGRTTVTRGDANCACSSQ